MKVLRAFYDGCLNEQSLALFIEAVFSSALRNYLISIVVPFLKIFWPVVACVNLNGKRYFIRKA
jgi:hypothetical protein